MRRCDNVMGCNDGKLQADGSLRLLSLLHGTRNDGISKVDSERWRRIASPSFVGVAMTDGLSRLVSVVKESNLLVLSLRGAKRRSNPHFPSTIILSCTDHCSFT